MLRDLLRPRPGRERRPAGLEERGRRPLRRDLESRLHAVRALGRRQDDAAAEALGRHRHGSRARGRRHAGRAFELRHRPVQEPDRGRGRRDAPEKDDEPIVAGHRGPHPRLFLPDRGRRDPGQRRPRLRAPPHHSPRDPPRLQARPGKALLPPARAGARAGNGPGVSGTREGRRSRRARAAPGRGALRRDARERHGAPRDRDQENERQDDRRRNGLQALRHLRIPGRSHGGYRARARAQGRPGRFRAGDGGPARAGARRQPFRRGHARHRHARRRKRIHGLRPSRGRRHGSSRS